MFENEVKWKKYPIFLNTWQKKKQIAAVLDSKTVFCMECGKNSLFLKFNSKKNVFKSYVYTIKKKSDFWDFQFFANVTISALEKSCTNRAQKNQTFQHLTICFTKSFWEKSADHNTGEEEGELFTKSTYHD